MKIAAALIALSLMLSGCVPAIVAAGLGFGAAAMNLDTEVLKAYLVLREGQHQQGPAQPAAISTDQSVSHAEIRALPSKP